MKDVYMKSDGRSDSYDELITELATLEDSLPKSIKNNIFNRMMLELLSKKDFINNCETPIEVLLGLEVRRELNYLSGGNKLHYFLHEQHEIKIDENKYRVDFLLAPVLAEGNTMFPNVVIECDGHNYHEKTKEQARKDKSRDRNLQSEGYRVIRFTGSEIFANPSKCAWEVVNIVKQIEAELGFGDQK